MARTNTPTTMSPGTFSTGNYIREEDAQAVQEMLNQAFVDGRRMHLWVRASDTAWDSSGDAVATHAAQLPNTTGAVTLYMFRLWVDPDAQDLDVVIDINPPASNEATAYLTIGGYTTATYTFTPGSGPDGETADVATIGTGLVTCTVVVEHTVGTDDTFVDSFYIQEAAPSIPGPPNE